MNITFAQELLNHFTYEGQEKALFRNFLDPSKHEHRFTALSDVGNE